MFIYYAPYSPENVGKIKRPQDKYQSKSDIQHQVSKQRSQLSAESFDGAIVSSDQRLCARTSRAAPRLHFNVVRRVGRTELLRAHDPGRDHTRRVRNLLWYKQEYHGN